MLKYISLILMTLAFTGNALAATEKAIFGGGCFWCMEPPYDKLEGIISTTSGYTGGHLENPNYQDVSSGRSGHVEVVEVSYDPEKVSYQQLLEVFWVNIDPLNSRGQFCDNGSQYLSAIFHLNENQIAPLWQRHQSLVTQPLQPYLPALPLPLLLLPDAHLR